MHWGKRSSLFTEAAVVTAVRVSTKPRDSGRNSIRINQRLPSIGCTDPCRTTFKNSVRAENQLDYGSSCPGDLRTSLSSTMEMTWNLQTGMGKGWVFVVATLLRQGLTAYNPLDALATLTRGRNLCTEASLSVLQCQVLPDFFASPCGTDLTSTSSFSYEYCTNIERLMTGTVP